MNRPDEERDVAPKWIGRGYFTTTGKRLSNEWFAALEGASEVNKNRGYQNIPHARPGPHVRAHQSFRATVAPGPRSGRLRAVTRFIYASSQSSHTHLNCVRRIPR